MVAPTIALTTPTDFAFPTFAEGDNWAQSYAGYVTFAPGSDQNATWTLSATSTAPYTSGQMYCSALNNFLVNPMDVSLGAGYAGLPGGVATSPSTNTNASFILYAHQYVTQSDILFGSGTYSIVVNLMATVNP
jgi:hypothetical protein